MEMLTDFIVMLSTWCRRHLGEISLALMATLLVLCGPAINSWVRRHIASFNFLLRTLIFVLVCALGYGLAIIFLTPWLTKALAQLNNLSLAPVLLLIFILVGVFADRS